MFSSPRLGSLMNPQGKIVDPSVTLPASSNAAQPTAGIPSVSAAPSGGGDVAPVRLGQLATPAAEAASAEAPVAPDSPEFQQRVERNKSFLGSTEVQAGLMQFAITMLGGGDIGGALGGGLAASGRARTNRLAEGELARKANIDERQMQVSEGQLELNSMETVSKLQGERIKQEMALRRQKALSGIDLVNAKQSDLLMLAQQLAMGGDNDTAKTIIDVANAHRLATDTQDTIEYSKAVQQGYDGTFFNWQQTKIKAGVPPAATAGMSEKMQEEGIKASNNADQFHNDVQDAQLLLDTVKQAKTGILTPYTLPIEEAFKQLGLSVTPDANNRINVLESLRAQQNVLALKLRSPASGFGLPGSASDQDLIFLKQAGPGLANAPEANVAMATIALAKAKRKAELESLRSQFIWENKTLSGWDGYKKAWVAGHDMLSSDDKDTLERIGNPEKRSIGAPQTPSKNVDVLSAPPDNLGQADKDLWPFMTEEHKREILDLPAQPVQ